MADPTPALKDWFDVTRYRHLAGELSQLHRGFDANRFVKLAAAGLDELSLMQRLRRTSECLRATLPDDFHQALTVLRDLAPRINHGFVTLVLPDFVGLYGREHFDASMEALKYFTRFGSAEFAVREFLRLDLERALATMTVWSREDCEHVRRLASEGCRPRLPWSFRLEALIRDPAPVVPILENLKADPSLYVRKSVANHLNDITKDHPGWVMDRLEQWDRSHAHTAWIAKRALRTLIKAGDRRALGLIGAGEKARVRVGEFTVTPAKVRLGERITITCELESAARRTQRLVVDYAIHYVKKSGAASGKVFKWKELELPPAGTCRLTRSQVIRDFTTRVHHPGRHRLILHVNGEQLGEATFDLKR
jgi:3-methyladenine DNA glycosylase AlkC